jgi:hypothetical protein
MGVGLTLLVLVVLNPIDEWFDKRRNALKGNDQPKST